MPSAARFRVRLRPTRSARHVPLQKTADRPCHFRQAPARDHPNPEPADDVPIAGGRTLARCAPAMPSVRMAVVDEARPDRHAHWHTDPAPPRPPHAATFRAVNAQRAAASIPGLRRRRPRAAAASHFLSLRRLTIRGPCVTAASPSASTPSDTDRRAPGHETQTAGVLRRMSQGVAALFPMAGRERERHVNSPALSMILRIEVAY